MIRNYIGLAATMHDSALAIVDHRGEPVFAEASERYLQCKRGYNALPDEMLRIGELVAQYCDPDAELFGAISWSGEHLAQLENVVSSGVLTPSWWEPEAWELNWPFPPSAWFALSLRNSAGQAGLNLTASQSGRPVQLRRYDHHLAHAATAVYTAPFDECVAAVIDGFGERTSTSFFSYHDGKLQTIAGASRQYVSGVPPASLGFFYARLCALCGFDPAKGEEWKVMGLAAHGRGNKELYDLLRPMIVVDGLNLISGCSKEDLLRRMRRLRALARPPGSSPIDAADLARAGQDVFCDVAGQLLQNLAAYGISENLAFAGGCALNSSFVGQVSERATFTRVHVPCAPADDGNALGAAFLGYCEDYQNPPPRERAQTPFLGSALSGDALLRLRLYGQGLHIEHLPGCVQHRTATLLSEGKIIGWVQGRAEFGPRALGNRSILADPRPADMKDRINARVKFREEFRPFAPSILEEFGSEYFENYQVSPYMERALHFRPEVWDKVPAVVHADKTGRLQSVSRVDNPRFYALIRAFYDLTGIPLLLNTSLNVMGKPIIHCVEDVLGMFFTTGLDALVLHDYLIIKPDA